MTHLEWVFPLKMVIFHSYGWLVVFRPTPLKNDGVKVSWDDDIPNIWKHKIPWLQTTNQDTVM